MTTQVFPQEIQNVLELLSEQGFEDTWYGLDESDRELTREMCCSDTCDFIVSVNGQAFLFTEVGSGWEVSPAAQ